MIAHTPLPIGQTGEQMVSKLCALDGWVENHAHVLKNCFFSMIRFDTVRQAFRLVNAGMCQVEPSRLLDR